MEHGEAHRGTRCGCQIIPTNTEDLKWVSCSKELDWSTAQHRHLARNPDKDGYVTTLCGATGSPGAFRGNSTKPICRTCVDRRSDGHEHD